MLCNLPQLNFRNKTCWKKTAYLQHSMFCLHHGKSLTSSASVLSEPAEFCVRSSIYQNKNVVLLPSSLVI